MTNSMPALNTARMTETQTAKPQLNPFLKLALDLGPLVLFFFANSRFGIFVATGDVHGRGAGGAWRRPMC